MYKRQNMHRNTLTAMVDTPESLRSVFVKVMQQWKYFLSWYKSYYEIMEPVAYAAGSFAFESSLKSGRGFWELVFYCNLLRDI